MFTVIFSQLPYAIWPGRMPQNFAQGAVKLPRGSAPDLNSAMWKRTLSRTR